MGRIWQWLWDRYAAVYSWVMWAVVTLVVLPVYLSAAFIVVALGHSTDYLGAAACTLIAVPAMGYGYLTPGRRQFRRVERWAVDPGLDRVAALEDTYCYARKATARSVPANLVGGGALTAATGVIAGAPWPQVLHYGLLGAATGLSVALIGAHSALEAALRPARSALVGDTAIGESLPRSRPTFAAWSNLAVVASAFGFAVMGAVLAVIFARSDNAGVVCVLIGVALAVGFAVPITVGTGFSPSLQPIRDLATATERVAAGQYSQRVPVVQDDDLGALAASFNRMQTGLLERQRLHAAFGTYVDPTLAARLLRQGDDVFTGERREVTVMFVDIRDFTPFAESNTAEDTVTRLNRLFEIVVPAVVDAGGHVNKFLGDGALAVFGAPNAFPGHADAASTAAVRIQTVVTEKFGTDLRVGIGINTGVVIAGTIGGGGKLEFTLIGDTVNVAARVEQLTKTTGDGILLTSQTVDAMAQRPPGLIERGPFPLKGKSAAVTVYGLAVPGGGNLGQANYARG